MNIPFNKTIKDLYRDSENGNTGFYPFGCGNLWHSGIHIKANNAIINPLIPGQLIAYRLRQKNSTASLPECVTKTYKETYLTGFSELYTQDEKNKTLYKRNQNRKIFSTDSFMLFKHSFPKLQYDFYTLYSNLNFISDENESLFKEKLIYDGTIQECSQENLYFSSIPVGNEYNGKKYFDFVVFSDQNIFDKKYTEKKDEKMLFTEFPKDIKFYTVKVDEIESFDKYMIPSASDYKKLNEKSNAINKCAEIELQSFNAYYRIDTDNKTKEKQVIWVTPCNYNNEHIDFRKNASAPIKNEALKYMQKIFTDNDFVTKYKKKEDSRSKRTEIKFCDIGAENPKFWIKGDDLNNFTSKVNECGKTTGEQNSIYSVFNECPYKYSFSETDKPDNYEDFEVDNESEYEDSKTGVIYYKIKEKEIYVKKDDVKNCFADAFDWNRWFIDCTKKIGNSDGIICDKNALIKEIKCNDELNELFNKAKKYYPLDFYRIFGGYGENDSNNHLVKLIRRQTRKIICKHPLEFDKSLFPDNKDKCKDFSKKYYKIAKETTVISPTTSACLRTESENFDIWDGGLSKIFTKGNNFFFLNPAYSLKHFERAGLLDFNPYEGKKYSEIFAKGQTVKKIYTKDRKKIDKEYNQFTVKSNPGFAPVYNKNLAGPNINGFAPITGFFNVDYIGNHDDYEYYYHEGVDFRGSNGTEVVSLVNGKIIKFGTSLSMQGCVLMQSNNDRDLYYLAVHLDDTSFSKYNLKEGKYITPGDKIAKIGKYPNGDHLHVSVIKLNKNDTVISKSGILYVENNTKLKKEILRFPIWGEPKKMINPFDYNSDHWAGRKEN